MGLGAGDWLFIAGSALGREEELFLMFREPLVASIGSDGGLNPAAGTPIAVDAMPPLKNKENDIANRKQKLGFPFFFMFTCMHWSQPLPEKAPIELY